MFLFSAFFYSLAAKTVLVRFEPDLWGYGITCSSTGRETVTILWLKRSHPKMHDVQSQNRTRFIPELFISQNLAQLQMQGLHQTVHVQKCLSKDWIMLQTRDTRDHRCPNPVARHWFCMEWRCHLVRPVCHKTTEDVVGRTHDYGRTSRAFSHATWASILHETGW